jgi:cell pole-organizing protein PopZ
MGNPSAAHEPSMEEILASIRQIISEDGDQSEEQAAASQSGGDHVQSDRGEGDEADRDSPVMQAGSEPAGELEEEPEESGGAEPAAAAPTRLPDAPPPVHPEPTVRHHPDPSADVRSAPSAQHQPAAAAAAAKPAQPVAGQGRAAGGGGGGLPAATMAGADDRRLLSPQANESVSGAFSALAHTILAQNARTLEDLVSEMLRPMLKDWLDDNLPPLVERLVKEEIERVSRGRR